LKVILIERRVGLQGNFLMIRHIFPTKCGEGAACVEKAGKRHPGLPDGGAIGQDGTNAKNRAQKR
jgi:hypothetical protein